MIGAKLNLGVEVEGKALFVTLSAQTLLLHLLKNISFLMTLRTVFFNVVRVWCADYMAISLDMPAAMSDEILMAIARNEMELLLLEWNVDIYWW